ncbi:HPr family phosphocarrier protein [Candidatus Aerophobetes bacterium]|nr:HPr family phosphocarrier protein [Candidatus Aerophobetes bacterium]
MVFQKEIKITNKIGLHTRPASLIVEVANKFKSKIWIEKDGQVANGKSVMSLLLLCVEKGSIIKIKAEGPDAQKAIEALVKIIKDKFGEE